MKKRRKHAPAGRVTDEPDYFRFADNPPRTRLRFPQTRFWGASELTTRELIGSIDTSASTRT